jgi:BsuBI/PstI restriction endonuclease domain/BsuBI/PstI restriction endonuclease HTH domain
MGSAGTFPALIRVEEVQRRLADVFPESFPDRALLIGKMAARVVFVFLYGGFLEGSNRQLRPSTIYLFTAEQARRTTLTAREAWLATAFRPGFRPAGQRWYADNSRESIRDDLIRNRLVSMGLVGRKPGVPTTSSAPVYFLRAGFAALFDPALDGSALQSAIENWRNAHLSSTTLKRMALKAKGALAKQSDVLVELPDATRIRLSAGPSTPILKALIEDYAPRWLRRPTVLWISASDRKTQPQFVEMAATVGLRIEATKVLPDLILADLGDPASFVFCEVVATDGPVDEARKAAFLELTRGCGIADVSVRFVTAYLDREAPALRKHFHRVAVGSDLWFSNEPELVVRLILANNEP